MGSTLASTRADVSLALSPESTFPTSLVPPRWCRALRESKRHCYLLRLRHACPVSSSANYFSKKYTPHERGDLELNVCRCPFADLRWTWDFPCIRETQTREQGALAGLSSSMAGGGPVSNCIAAVRLSSSRLTTGSIDHRYLDTDGTAHDSSGPPLSLAGSAGARLQASGPRSPIGDVNTRLEPSDMAAGLFDRRTA